MAKEPEYYRRCLPHWQPADGVFHLVLRLHGSLPRAVIQRLQLVHQKQVLEIEQTQSDPFLRETLISQEHQRYFAEFDHMLDQGLTGPHWLKNEEIAGFVQDCFLYWHAEQRFKLVAFCIMPNHVHAIVYKIQRPLFRIFQTIKTYTAKQANSVLHRHGKHFWQRETYDHLIRDRKEFNNQLLYVLNNPVKARLVEEWRDWPFFWCNPVWQTGCKNEEI